MAEAEELEKLTREFETGIAQEKCRKCGCMKGALEEILDGLEADTAGDALELKTKVKAWLGKAEESRYT
jgi:hypothetical protein